MKRFSDRFLTFFDWEKQSSNSNYAKRIRRLHYFFPKATLRELIGREKLESKKLSIHLVDPRGLKPNERLLRNQSLSVLSRIRRGEESHGVIDESQISNKNLLKHLGNNIKIKQNRIKVTKSDRIPRELIIKEDGIESSIVVRNSKDASIIGRYHNAVRDFLDTGNPTTLRKFKKIRIKDADGTIHKLETNPNKIIEIEDRKEEPEAFEIYKS